MSCNDCGESRFSNAAQLRCHGYTNHARFSCDCSKKFMNEEGLESHKKEMQNNAKACPCSACCRSFKSKHDLHQHKRSTNHWENNERNKAQEETNRVFCDDRCGRSFKSASALADHKRDIAANFEINDKTCRACSKTFVDNTRLDQHQERYRDSSKSTSRVKEYLDNFHKNKIAMDKGDKKKSVKLVDGTLRQIMDHVNKSKGGEIYCKNVVRAGSFPVKTKIGKPDEFDTNIVCNIAPDCVKTRGTTDFGYKPLDKRMGKSNNMNIKMNLKDIPGGKEIPMGYADVTVKDGTVPEKLTYKGHLVPREVKRDLHDKIKTAMADLGLKNVDVSRNAHGPALTLNMHQGHGCHDISVDITVSIPCQVPISDNGWPRPSTCKALNDRVIDDIKKVGTHLVPKGDTVWAVSYSKAEKAALAKIDEGNGCRREVNRIMKKHVQDCTSRSENGLPGVSSHIIKQQILWSAEKRSDTNYWQHGNLHNCLIDTMGDMASALNRGKLPNYFSNSENILRGKDPEVLGELSNHFKQEMIKMLHL